MPILATKLFVPHPRPQLVPRTRLIDRLNAARRPGHKLIILAAPAGFGKTTLLSDWIAGARPAVAWLSLDETDNDPERFLSYVVAALRTLDEGMGAETLNLLQARLPPLGEVVLTALVNDIARLPGDSVLVLDDYHLIDQRPIHEAIAFLLDHLPPRLQLVLAGRADPPLPLARLRARGELTELRAADLRFASNEAAAFLNQAMGLDLAAADVAALEARTEGWIAGLQLAALSLQGRPAASEFVQAFAGDHRYIADYLIEEVLQRQPDSVRRFLLETSILDRLSGPLCEAVTGQADGAAQLDALERGNLFVVALDDRRRWYRYHHLFAEVLRAHLRVEPADVVAALHHRASIWHERNGAPADAIRHALAAGDAARAADLIELAVPEMRRNREEARLLGWLRALPDDLLRARPVLSFAYVGVLMQSGEFDGVETRLRDAERWLEAEAGEAPRGKMVVADKDELRRLPGSIAVHRAGFALVHGDLSGTLRHARRALEVVAEDDHLGHGSASALLGLASWTNGDLETARGCYVEAITRLHKAGHLSDMLGCALTLADIQVALGRLRDAQRTCEQALEATRISGAPVLRGTADMFVCLSDLHRERNEFEAALTCLRNAEALGEHLGLPQNPYRRRLALARIRQATGDFDGALALLAEAERRYDGDFSPDVRPIAAWRARVWLAQGRLDDAVDWARARAVSPADEPTYLHEFDHLTLARVLLAQTRRNRDDHLRSTALDLLERLERAATTGGRQSAVIECLVLQALAHHARGATSASLAPLCRALALAEPEGFMRVFVDEGAPLGEILKTIAVAGGPTAGYAQRLLAAMIPANDRPPASGGSIQALVEPLSERELDVLRLLRTELSGPEIARHLVVSLNTFNTHTRNIYGKLGVSNRRAAVRRADDLGLA